MSLLNNWNQAVYSSIHPNVLTPLVPAAKLLSELPLIAALMIGIFQIIKHRDVQLAVRMGCACVTVLIIEFVVNAYAFHPRPFAAGFGPAWAVHEANNSMPSTHVALTFAIAILLTMRGFVLTSCAVFILGFVMAWARIYVGIHWPADMVGALASAGVSAFAAQKLVSGMLSRLRQNDRSEG